MRSECTMYMNYMMRNHQLDNHIMMRMMCIQKPMVDEACWMAS